MPKITFDTDDYYDDEELRDMIEQETRCYIHSMVSVLMEEHEYWVPNFVSITAQKVVENALAEKIDGYKQKIAEKVEEYVEDMCDSRVLYSDEFKRVLEDCVEDCRPVVRDSVYRVCRDKVNAHMLVDCVCDEFYKMIEDMLCGKSDGEGAEK